MTISGKSKSQQNPQGIRRTVNGKELAPRSLRSKKKLWYWLEPVPTEFLSKAGITK